MVITNMLDLPLVEFIRCGQMGIRPKISMANLRESEASALKACDMPMKIKVVQNTEQKLALVSKKGVALISAPLRIC